MGDLVDRYFNRTPEERAELRAQMERRYRHLMDRPRDWIADPTKNRPAAGTDENRKQ